jgi:putative phosphoribosyl transferase
MKHIGATVAHPPPAFRDRRDAGRMLAEFVDPDPRMDWVLMALPRGGVPVADPIAEFLEVPIELAIARKLPIPTSPEAGFGAVALDGSTALNEDMLQALYLSERQINAIAEEVREEVRRRAREYLGHDNLPELSGKHVMLIDDGLATGYTMIAAAKMVRKLEPGRIVLAVPVSPVGSIRAVEEYFDDIHCLIAQTTTPFAVASFYLDFHDLSDGEVRKILRESRERLTKTGAKGRE